jgi:hypothetical protein
MEVKVKQINSEMCKNVTKSLSTLTNLTFHYVHLWILSIDDIEPLITFGWLAATSCEELAWFPEVPGAHNLERARLDRDYLLPRPYLLTGRLNSARECGENRRLPQDPRWTQ